MSPAVLAISMSLGLLAGADAAVFEHFRGGAAPVWVDREAVLMGARLRVQVEATSDAAGNRIIDRVFDVVTALDRRWTTRNEGSELSGLRSAAIGLPVSLSNATLEMLLGVWDLADRTDHAFEPGLGPLLDAWGTAREVAREPAAAELAHAMRSVGRPCFDLSPASRTLTRHCPDAWIDGGAFGKGAALAVVDGILDEEAVERARIDFGGQLLLRGSPLGPDGVVDLADPRDRGPAAFRWPAARGSFATSAQSGWRFEAADGDPRRVLDPRSGRPVEDWGSVTVRSADPLEADALATALLVMGPRDGIRWLAARPGVEAVLIVIGETGIVACGRASVLESLLSLAPDATVSEAPLVTPDLRACPEGAGAGDHTDASARGPAGHR